jgi:hypothetical protein
VSVVCFSKAGSSTSGISFERKDLPAGCVRKDTNHGVHILLRLPSASIQIYLTADLSADDLLQVNIPFDCMINRRLVVLNNLARAIEKKPLPNPARPSPQTIRLHRSLLAIDACHAQASHREIAEVIYGVERVKDELWKTSSLRQAVLRLCATGTEMMDGGYSRLLLE